MGGNVNSNVVNSLTLRQTSNQYSYNPSHPYLAVSPASSGNVGTTKPISGGRFAQMEEGQYVARMLATKIAGVASNVLKTGASDVCKKPIPRLETARRLDITSWDYATGTPTYGVNRGASVSFGNDNAARPSFAVPGKLVFTTGRAVPTATAYEAKKNT